MIILHFDLQLQFKYMNHFIYTSHHYEFYLEKGEVIFKTYYSVLVLRTSPFYDPPSCEFHNIDPPPFPAWDKSNCHKLKEPLKTVWNISLLGGR